MMSDFPFIFALMMVISFFAGVLIRRHEEYRKLTGNTELELNRSDLKVYSLSWILNRRYALTKLTLIERNRNTYIGESIVHELSDAIINSKSALKQLTVMNAAMINEALARFTTAMKTLTYVRLFMCNINADGARTIADALAGCSFLEGLDLMDNDIGVSGARSIAAALPASVQFLGLSCCNIGAGGARAVMSALVDNCTLVILELNSNGIGSDGARAVMSALATNHSISDLNLSNNDIGLEGIRAIATALETNRVLKTLNVSGNPIGDIGARAFSESLACNNTLTKLNLSRSNIGMDGAGLLSSTLDTNRTLLRIYLRGNGLRTTVKNRIADRLHLNQIYAGLHKWVDQHVPGIGQMLPPAYGARVAVMAYGEELVEHSWRTPEGRAFGSAVILKRAEAELSAALDRLLYGWK